VARATSVANQLPEKDVREEVKRGKDALPGILF
jgi:hypothetical protein